MYVELTAVFTHTHPMPALPRQRSTGGSLRDRAHGRPRRRPGWHRSGGAAPAQLRAAGGDAVQDLAHLHLRLRRVREGHGPGAQARRRRQASTSAGRESKKQGKLRGLGMSNTIERAAAASFEGAEIRFDRTGTVTLFSGSINQGQGHETIFKQIVADKLGVHPDEIEYIQGDTDKVFFGEGTGGSRSATHVGFGVHDGRRQGDRQGQAHRRAQPQGRRRRREFRRRHLLQHQDQPDHHHQGRGGERHQPGEAAEGHGGSACSRPRSTRRRSRTSRTACTSARSRSIRRPASCEIVRYSVVDDVGTVINPLLLKGQIVGGVAQGVGQILMEDIHFDGEGQLLTGSFMDYAMPRAHDFCPIEVKSQSGADQDQPARRQGRGRGRLRRRDAGGGERAGRCAVASSASLTSRCRRRRRWCGGRWRTARDNDAR